MPVPRQRRSYNDFIEELVEIANRLPIPMAVVLNGKSQDVRTNAACAALLDGAEVSGQLFATGDAGDEVRDHRVDFERADGTRASLLQSAWPLLDEGGIARGSIAVFADVTERSNLERSAELARSELRAAEARYRLIAEAMPQFVWIDAPDGSAVYANRRWLEYIGMSAEENAGFGWTAIVHPEDSARLDPIRAQTLRTGEDFEGECRYKGKDGKFRWFLFRSIAVRDDAGNVTSWVGTATDIDRQKRAEEQQKFFATASELLGSTLDEKTTLERIARLCVPDLADWCLIDLVDTDENVLKTVIAEHADESKRDKLQRFIGTSHLQADSAFGAPYVVRTGEAQMFPYIDTRMIDQAFSDPQDRKICHEAGFSSALIVPLKSGDTIYGALTLMSADAARLYTAFDLTTATEFARRGAIAMEHSRLFEREHLVATTLQRALLPQALPEMEHVRFASAYSAAVTGEEVGGDWYDAFALPNGRIALSMGDVAGHGLDAAVTMGAVRQAIRAAALERSQPSDVLSRANSTLALEGRETMVTAIFATYEPHSRIFEYAIAGHPAPVVADKQGNITVVTGTGPPLGTFFDTQRAETHHVTIPAGASVVFYTDGLIEFDRDIARAEARLWTLLRHRRHATGANPAAEIIHGVLDGPQRDDIAVLVMSLDETAELVDVVLPAEPQAAPVARNIMRDFVRFHQLDEDRLFDVLAAGGEAVSNAIEHPYGGGPGTFRMRIAMIDSGISLEVSDAGKWRNTVSVDRGRGFTIMRSVSKSFDINRTHAGTTVRLML